MNRGRVFGGIALVAALALPLAACAGKTRLSAKTMCEGAGGTYSMANQTCAPGSAPRAAKAICEAHGGVYMADLQMCEVEGVK